MTRRSIVLFEYIPTAFLTLACAHFIALITPGADFFLIVGHSLRSGFKGSRFICLGIAIGNALYIAFTIMGLMVIRQYPIIFIGIECIGAAYLLWMGVLLLKNQSNSQWLSMADGQNERLSALSQLIMGVLSALLNPKNFIFYVSLMTSVLGGTATLKQQLFAGVWMFFVVLCWDLLIAYAMGSLRSTSQIASKLYLIERIAGTILIIIALGIIIHLVNFII